MSFTSDAALPSKAHRARAVALATALLLIRGGERVGLTGLRLPPKRGAQQLEQMAMLLSEDSDNDYGTPEAQGMLPHSRAFFISDFLGDLTATREALLKAADRGVRGALLQVLDPQEEAFPFDGRTIFQSMTGARTFVALSRFGAAGMSVAYLHLSGTTPGVGAAPQQAPQGGFISC